MKGIHIYLLSGFAFLLLFSIGCSNGNKADDSKKTFCLTDTMARMVTIDTAKMERVKDELVLNGKIDANGDKVIRIYPFVSGNVAEVNVQLGDYVQKGQTLCSNKKAVMWQVTSNST